MRVCPATACRCADNVPLLPLHVAAVHDAAGSPADFNPASPDGSYTLDLSVAAERAVAVQLAELDRANASGSGPDLMRNITLDGKVGCSRPRVGTLCCAAWTQWFGDDTAAAAHFIDAVYVTRVALKLPTYPRWLHTFDTLQAIPSAKKANWPAMLPSRGSLACSFASSSLRRPLGVMEPSKLATLQRQLRAPSMSDRERLELVAMFAPFALFSCKQVRRLRRCCACVCLIVAGVAGLGGSTQCDAQALVLC